MSKLFKNTLETRLLLDRRPGSRSSYSVDGSSSISPAGQPRNIIEVDDGDLTLPGIADAIAKGILVPFEGFTKESLKPSKKEETKVPDIKTEAPVVPPTEPVVPAEAVTESEPVVSDSKKEGHKKAGK